MKETNKAVVTVIGKDTTGILSSVSTAVAAGNGNVIDVTQSVLDGYFCMIMIIDTAECKRSISELQEDIRAAVPNMEVHVMHSSIFDAMHRI